MHLKDFDSDSFLRDYWQKKPLLIRDAWTSWQNPIEPDDLAGLACEEEVESRLVTGACGNWHLEHGPLPENRFDSLGTKDWTLLVQAVDHFVPEVAQLIEAFRFIPDWRIDDVMVSFAAENGGVGPHFDQYDVFLVQGLGKRRWQIGGMCDETTPLLPHDDLRLLAGFEATEDWVLGAGDMLYVPPGIAHNGVALTSDCMTYSIGFRAPSQMELLADLCDHLLSGENPDPRYCDPDLKRQVNPGEIGAEAVARIRKMVVEAISDPAMFDEWLGEYLTQPKYGASDWAPELRLTPDGLEQELALGQALVRNPASRFSYISKDASSVLLFADGESFDCGGVTAGLARRLCGASEVILSGEETACAMALGLVTDLFNSGSLEFAEGGRS